MKAIPHAHRDDAGAYAIEKVMLGKRPGGRSSITMLADLTSEELAAQLRDPQGEVGVAVALALASINAGAIAAIMERIDLAPGMAVLELGCGLGDMATRLALPATGVTYTGLDQSATMVDAAVDRHATGIAAGRASFLCATSEHTNFPNQSFDRLFSIGLIHFWSDPARSLAECRRVLRKGGMMLMAGLGVERAPPFASAENGFHLRPSAGWQQLAVDAGFHDVAVHMDNDETRPQGLLLMAMA